MLLGIDFDDVVADSMDVIVRLHNGKYGTAFKKEDVVAPMVEEVWGGTQEEWRAKLDEFFGTKHLAELSPMAGAIPAMRELKVAGHELYIMTARSDRDVEATELWLTLHFPDVFRGVHYGQSLSDDPAKRRSKAAMCKELGVELMIDDHMKNAVECAAAGIPALLFDQPWNQGELPPGVKRVRSWNEIVERVKGMGKG